MIRFLLLIAALFAVVLGFSWLKDAPGEVTVIFAGTAYTIGLARAVLAALILLFAALVVVGLIVFLLRLPMKARLSWRQRREKRYREAVSTGLLAIAAGDISTAERATHELSRRGDDPLTLLLKAQTAQLKGDHAAARNAFQAMLEHEPTRIVGLRGLFIEAAREGEHEAARAYAEQARDLSASTPWASRALLRYQAAEGEWGGALKTLSRYAETKAIDRKSARRLRAVILTAEALGREDAEPEKAKEAAIEAHGLEPGLVPAAVVAGRLLARLGDIRRASKILETTWKANPHPEIADAYAHVRPGDSARDRFQRIETLMKMRPNEDAARLVMARAAINARDWSLAREALTPVVKTRPTQNALLLMAEIEEGEHGNRGRMREWLSRAVHAPRDPVWTADGVVLEEWSPISPVTGRLDAVEWRVPVEEPESRRMIDIDEDSFKPLELAAVTGEAARPDTAARHGDPVTPAPGASPASPPSDAGSAGRQAAGAPTSSGHPSPAPKGSDPKAPASKTEATVAAAATEPKSPPETAAAKPASQKAEGTKSAPAPAPAATAAGPAERPAPPPPTPPAEERDELAARNALGDSDDEEDEHPKLNGSESHMRPPDDPGPEEGDEEDKKSRFRLF
ncbi:heme biosynthesis protein HemY [Afifella sp. IM 167]|uniref:heme biosynthesis protein HemY n=1 Tax=Afifella sp. IM 167 TaxID=2033586 RepID=UPI001CCFDE3C|nr:heme biosynthesis HemY N-terminal domain-containing protein [Afifella sp. IM 167]MBZ8134948.1 heme biosynthesis protein HemY [Afifella sp. IM 167]